jgi:hypothetical protein
LFGEFLPSSPLTAAFEFRLSNAYSNGFCGAFSNPLMQKESGRVGAGTSGVSVCVVHGI